MAGGSAFAAFGPKTHHAAPAAADQDVPPPPHAIALNRTSAEAARADRRRQAAHGKSEPAGRCSSHAARRHSRVAGRTCPASGHMPCPRSGSPPGSQSCSSRAAILTPSPKRSPSSATTSPILTPMPEDNTPLRGNFGLPCSSFLLDCHRAFDRIDDRAELNDSPIARQLDDMAMMLGKERINYLVTQSPDGSQGSGLVLFDQPRIAHDVGSQNSHQPPFDRNLVHGRPPGGPCRSSSVAAFDRFPFLKIPEFQILGTKMQQALDRKPRRALSGGIGGPE